MRALHRFVLTCSVVVAMMSMAMTPGQAAELLPLSDGDLDLVVAAGAGTRVLSVVRLGRYQAGMRQEELGLADRPRSAAIALLLPAIQSAREAARGRSGGGFFYSNPYTSFNSAPF